jgi:hypothetical protein
MTETENHNLNIPPKGTDDWAVPLNQNFEQLEVGATVVDTHVTIDPSIASDADTVQYTPHNNALFIAHDSGAVFHGDGTAWTQIGSLPVTKSVTKSGDGSQTTFTVSHDLPAAPSQVTVTPTSAAAAGGHWVSRKGDTEVDVTFTSAPASGTDNVTFDVSVEV